MFEYLQKFKKLPTELQEAVTYRQATQAISELEQKYGVDLDVLVIKLMVKDIPWSGLRETLTGEHHLSAEQAAQLQGELAQRVFGNVKRYLGIKGIKNAELRNNKNNERNEVSSQKPATEPAAPQPLYERIAVVLPDALRAAGFSSTDDIAAARLKNIITIFYRGIRDALDTRETLMKPREAGGLGLAPERAAGVVTLLQGGKPAAVPAPRPAPPPSVFDTLESVRDVEYTFQKSEIPKLAPPPPVIIQNKQTAKTFTISPEKLQQAERTLQQGSITGPKPPTVATPSRRPRDIFADTSERIQMNDIVKPPVKLQGPLEELGGIDATIFRRLGETVAVASEKIANKIALLGRESITRRQEGVNAWRHSPLYGQYLALGQESFRQGKPVAEVIAGKQGTLTIDEFNAIVELNNKLRV